VRTRRAPRDWPAVGVAALLVVAGPAVAAPAAPPGVARLEREYRAHRLAVRPDLATRAGDRRGDDRLEPVTQASLAAEAEWLAGFAPRLEAAPRAGRTPTERATLDSLVAWTARAHDEIALARRWERDPAAYLDLAGESVRALLTGRGKPVCGRVRAVARRLGRVPEVLRAAQVNLREPAPERVAAALPGYEQLLALYRAELPAFAARCREPRAQADLAEADTLAVRAVQDFLDYLRQDLLPRTGGGPGPEPIAPR
jgi:hypothetical protein